MRDERRAPITACVCIVNYNTRDQLRLCLTALHRDSLLELRIVVADNASTDGSAVMVRQEFPSVRLLALGHNLGFAGAFNVAVEGDDSDYVMVLNPDVEISPATVVQLITFLETTPAAAVAAPLLHGADGAAHTHLYRRFPTTAQLALFWTVLAPLGRAVPWLRRRWFEHDLRGTDPVSVEQVPGAALVMRSSALRHVGPWDSGYFIWFEDVDWCYRARQAGFELYVVPSATAAHEGGASFGDWGTQVRVFQFYRSFFRFLGEHRMHRLRRVALPLLSADLAVKHLLLGFAMRISGRPPVSLAPVRAAIRDIAAKYDRGATVRFTSAAIPRNELPAPAPAPIPMIGDDRDVDVVVVNWNGRRYLPQCLDALATSSVPIRIVVVDNASTDDSVEFLRQSHPEVEVVALDRNVGYAAGANAGLHRSSTRYALVMNPDVMIEPEHLEILCDRLDADSRIGAAQGKLFSTTSDDFVARRPTRRILDSAGHRIRHSRMVVDRGQGEPDAPLYDQEASVFSACGAALFLRRAMLDDIAPDGEYFGESFFAYKEDIDLGWRARLLGWDVRYIPQAVAHHVRTVPYGPRSWRRLSPAARRHSWKNHYLLMLRNDRAMDLLRALPFVVAWELLRLGHAVLRDPSVLPAYAAALRQSVGALRARRDTFARRRVTPEEIRAWFGADTVPMRSTTTLTEAVLR